MWIEESLSTKKQEAINYFTNLHDVVCNQKYNNVLPYSFHLRAVEANFYRWRHLIRTDEEFIAFVGCWGHDSIEDARLTFNDLKDKYGQRAAEVIFLCSEMRGRNRQERKSDQFYKELSVDHIAVFVKLCDIAANMMFGLLTKSDMFIKAKAEYPGIREKLYRVEYDEIFLFLDKLNEF